MRKTTDTSDTGTTITVPVEGATLFAAVRGDGGSETGTGRPIVLLHGWPHTHRLWDAVAPDLARDRTVVTPDLRGTGASCRASTGYDAAGGAADILAVLDAVSPGAPVDLVAIDASVPAAAIAAHRHPDRFAHLVLCESLLPPLPGAEGFLADGPPWWFGFHAIPGLAETVVDGREDEYLGWFLRLGTHDRRGIDPAIATAFIDAYRGRDSLRSGFEYYRVAAENAAQIGAAAASDPITVPVLAIGGDAVGDALARQLAGFATHLSTALLPEAGHMIPLDRPEEFLELVRGFVHDAVEQAAQRLP